MLGAWYCPIWATSVSDLGQFSTKYVDSTLWHSINTGNESRENHVNQNQGVMTPTASFCVNIVQASHQGSSSLVSPMKFTPNTKHYEGIGE